MGKISLHFTKEKLPAMQAMQWPLAGLFVYRLLCTQNTTQTKLKVHGVQLQLALSRLNNLYEFLASVVEEVSVKGEFGNSTHSTCKQTFEAPRLKTESLVLQTSSTGEYLTSLVPPLKYYDVVRGSFSSRCQYFTYGNSCDQQIHVQKHSKEQSSNASCRLR